MGSKTSALGQPIERDETSILQSISRQEPADSREDILSQATRLRCLRVSEETVCCVFTWRHPGVEVILTGSFCNWIVRESHRLSRIGNNEFVTIKQLPKGIHHYKFIVDGQWKFASEQDTIKDQRGNINNVLDISNFEKEDFDRVTDLEQAQYATYVQSVAVSMLPQTPSTFPALLMKSIPVAADPPPPRLGIPLHLISNHIYEDKSTCSVFGPHIKAYSVTTSNHQKGSFANRHTNFIFVTHNREESQSPNSFYCEVPNIPAALGLVPNSHRKFQSSMEGPPLNG
eukprot:GHVP01010743.1.p1 GENE.GHVP01010743.1~~GHVP01010743.1.p1  ORF type:complete len:286 (+),score=46.87 GHVP01010743.1:51-908(+)